MRRLVVSLCLVLAAVPAVAIIPTPTPVGAVATFAAHGSVNQVYATGLTPSTQVDLLDQADSVVDTGTSDTQGAFLFRSVVAGSGYQVRSQATTVSGLTVTDPADHPADSFYATQATDHPLVDGYQYLTTRDGTQLSVNIHFPSDGSPGPWPVVVDYSGYDPSQPGGPPAEALVYQVQGYVVVGVNMRGTGCSGGAFEFMETLQGLDGYDVIESLAHQTWSNGHVGMVGISYSGYSQLYVAATNPPHLDAITPLSPYADTYSGILYPGGILNDGFAVSWAADREAGAQPAARPWVQDRINGGDTVCSDNQALRLQSKPLLSRIHATPYIDTTFAYLNAETFVHQIKTPTFLSSQWQDEQTGGSAANLIALFDPKTKVYANFTNGTHVEPMAPAELYEAMNFIDLYVGKRIPHTNPAVQSLAPSVLSSLFGAGARKADFALPVNNWSAAGTYANALKFYEARPRVRIRWENGTVTGKEGLPIPAVVTRHTTWPLSGLADQKLYFQPDGALAADPSQVPDNTARAFSSYTYDPTSKRRQTFDGSSSDAWAPHPAYHWNVLKSRNSLSFLSPKYPQTVAYAGQGSVDLWVRSSAPDTDVEATLTEVRPDGYEVYIQSGWLRASHRKEDPAKSTELVPFQTHTAADAAPLPGGTFTKMRIELFPFAHVIRPGSRLRVNIEVPGGNQPFWAFAPLAGTSTNDIGHSVGMRSRVVLPRVPLAQTPKVPAKLPACSLAGVTTQAVSYRNQPCRIYSPARRATGVQAYAEDNGLIVTWRPPPGPAPDGYRITPSFAPGAPGGATALPVADVPGGSASVSLGYPNVDEGVPYQFTVQPLYGGVPGLASDASPPAVAQPLGIKLFGNWETFVRQQLSDFLQATPPLDVIQGVAAMRAGVSEGQYITSLQLSSDGSDNVAPVTRLYLAAFRRVPEPGGLHFWVGQRRAGMSMTRMADLFAASPAFSARYGMLSNSAFVQKLYVDVLGRPADAAGLTYWAGRLNAGVLRGSMLAQFASGHEFVVNTRYRVLVADLVIGLLGRAPTGTELTNLSDALGTGSSLPDIVGPLLGSAEYAARFA